MAEILLFHHAQGLTAGCVELAEELRGAGHVVHVLDLFDGRTFTDLDEGVAYAEAAGFETILDRGRRSAEGLSEELVYMGLSLGVMPAQLLAQTRPGAKGALLLHGCVPASEFGGWPAGVPAQIHVMESDPWAEEDLPAARDLAATTEGVELFVYPGEAHLFTDASLPSYDEGAATQVTERLLTFLAAAG